MSRVQPRDRRPLSLESLEPRQVMATTATLMSSPPPVQLSVTFQGDTAPTPAFATVYVGQLRWSGAQGDARAAGLPDASCRTASTGCSRSTEA